MAGFDNRKYSKGERGHYVYDQFKGAHKFNKYFYLKTGTIEDVDPDKYEMTVVWGDRNGTRDRIPISFAFSSPAACMGALPDKGAIGIFQFYNEGTGKGSPLLLSYLPSGLNAGMSNNTVKIYPDVISTSDINQVNFRHRKLNPGNMIMNASSGSLIFLSNSAEIQNAMQDTILLLEDDESIISTSVNNFIFANGASISLGPALRNALPIYDPDTGVRLDNNGSPMPLLIGKDNIYIVPHGDPIKYGTKYYTEFRVDVDEQGDRKKDLNDINSSSPISGRDPIVTFALGNYIGADRRNHLTYGNILKASLFNSLDDQSGALALSRAMQNNGVDEPSILGLAYALHFKNNSFIGMDKEGHYYMNLLASKMNGAGRSMSLNALGSLKEVWGQTTTESNSWDLTASGGITWRVGSHNTKRQSRSIDITTTKGISIEVGGADDNGYAKSEILQGHVSEIVTGDKSATCRNLQTLINGAKIENVSGGSFENVQGIKSISTPSYSENIVNLKQSNIGKRKTTITTGNDELTIMKGSLIETIPFGKRSSTVATGDSLSKGNAIEETIGFGHRVTTIGTGNYTVDVQAGLISIKTKVGTVSIGGNALMLNGTVMAEVKAPLVKLGNKAVPGAVITGLPGLPTHFDYVTGAPLMGTGGVYA